MVATELKDGVLDEVFVPSRSSDHYYHLVRTAGGWQHTDSSCRGWLIRGECAHVKERNLESTALVASNTSVLALIDDLEDREIVEALSGQVTRSWIYEFPMSGSTVRGISAVGVEEASGEMAKHGEALRVIDVKIDYEDESEARFMVQAGRYAISADGREALLDVTIRGKRQPKKMKLRNGGWQDDEHWYEKGITKAVRNAKLALMPEYAKTHILTEAVKAGRVKQVDGPPAARQARVSAPRPSNVDEDGVIDQTVPMSDAPIDLLNAIEAKHGKDAKVQAIAVMGRNYGTQQITALKKDDRAEYAAILKVRLEHTQHEHEAALKASGFTVCLHCGDVMDPPSGDSEPVQATLG